MENKKIVEQIVINKRVKAIMSAIDEKNETRPYFTGFLIEDKHIWATDTKLIARMKLSEVEVKENYYTENISTGADEKRTWVSLNAIKWALKNLVKKTVHNIQDNIYVNQEEGTVDVVVLDNNLNQITMTETTNKIMADGFPQNLDQVYNTEKDEERYYLAIAGDRIIKLAEMVKALKDKDGDGEIIFKIDTQDKQGKTPVNFEYVKGEEGALVEGCFMPIVNKKGE